jgi:hypothetical protein
MEFLAFTIVCKRFWPLKFLGVNFFVIFSTDSKSASSSAFYDGNIEFLPVLQIHEILVPVRTQKLFCLLLFKVIFASFFKDKKS